MHANVSFSAGSKRLEAHVCYLSYVCMCMCVTIAVLGNGRQHRGTGYTAALFIIIFLSLAGLSKERIRRRDKRARDPGANGSVLESAGMIAVIHYRSISS